MYVWDLDLMRQAGDQGDDDGLLPVSGMLTGASAGDAFGVSMVMSRGNRFPVLAIGSAGRVVVVTASSSSKPRDAHWKVLNEWLYDENAVLAVAVASDASRVVMSTGDSRVIMAGDGSSVVVTIYGYYWF